MNIVNISQARKSLEDFQFKVLLIGITPQKKPNQFEYKNEVYHIRGVFSPTLLSMFESKEEAILLLRLSVLIQLLSSQCSNFFDSIEAEFEQLIKYYPIFGTYFYGSRAGGWVNSAVTKIH